MCVCVCVCVHACALNLVKKLAQDQGRLSSSEPITVLCAHNTRGEAEDEADSDNTDDMTMTEMMAAAM